MSKSSSSKASKAKEEATKPDDVVVTPHRRELLVGLTREQVEDRASELSMLIASYDIEDAQAKERAKHDKMKLRDMNTDLRRLGNVVRDKCEKKLVPCERRMNFTQGRVTDVRLDTGDVLEERDMTDDERQKGLPFAKDADVEDEFGDETAEA